ncbi:hypothetical protein C5167_037408 [Papaver somniferum]|uniref:SAM-dependent MTase RsmB/NOP-type domain-containing protein n=1 Tax=Papaver somniferum TaxID=3469 RepID=A0A4Y7I699_PAPSO|nr:hypothetical protein C5167_037408 [Papaver somniferum]
MKIKVYDSQVPIGATLEYMSAYYMVPKVLGMDTVDRVLLDAPCSGTGMNHLKRQKVWKLYKIACSCRRFMLRVCYAGSCFNIQKPILAAVDTVDASFIFSWFFAVGLVVYDSHVPTGVTPEYIDAVKCKLLFTCPGRCSSRKWKSGRYGKSVRAAICMVDASFIYYLVFRCLRKTNPKRYKCQL